MINLNGKIAFITGAAQGIGRSIAKELGKAGAEVRVKFKNKLKQASLEASAHAAWRKAEARSRGGSGVQGTHA